MGSLYNGRSCSLRKMLIHKGAFPARKEHQTNCQKAPDIDAAKIMTLTQMERFIENQQARIIKFPAPAKKHIADPELKAIDKLLDDSMLNLLLAPPG